jgi:hypothetical protein
MTTMSNGRGSAPAEPQESSPLDLSQNGAQLPRRELLVAEAEALALSPCPDATASMSSKICRPAAWTVAVPSTMVSQLRSISSDTRAYISVLVDSFGQGAGLGPERAAPLSSEGELLIGLGKYALLQGDVGISV